MTGAAGPAPAAFMPAAHQPVCGRIAAVAPVCLSIAPMLHRREAP